MSFEKFVHYVRTQPTPVRRVFAFSAAVCVMVFVVGVWLLGMKETFHQVASDVPDLGREIKENALPDADVPPSLESLAEVGKRLIVDEGLRGDAAEKLFEEQLQAREEERPVEENTVTRSENQ